MARGFEPDISLVGEDETGVMADAFLDGSRWVFITLTVVGVVAVLSAWRVVMRKPKNSDG